MNLETISLSGVAEALEKHAKEGGESKGIKAHFAMDESGILNMINVELVSEKTETGTPSEAEGAFSKIGSTISKLFSGLFSAVMPLTRVGQLFIIFIILLSS